MARVSASDQLTRLLALPAWVAENPGVTVKDSEQPCCGIAGTYGMKKEKYAIAQAVGAPVFDFIKQVNAELAACDTETCRWQLRTATGANVVHPIWLIHKAYGLPNG